MARLGLGLLAAVAVLALASGAASQAPAPAPSSSVDCGAAVAGLLPCLSYVQQGSPQGKPAMECCAGVKGALKSPATVACLCAAFKQKYPVAINMTRAATLPAACGEDQAAFSKCNSPAPASGSAPAANSPGASKSAAARSPVSAFAVVAAVAAPLLSYYYL